MIVSPSRATTSSSNRPSLRLVARIEHPRRSRSRATAFSAVRPERSAACFLCAPRSDRTVVKSALARRFRRLGIAIGGLAGRTGVGHAVDELRAILDAVRTGELFRTQALDVVEEVHALKAGRALAITAVGVGTAAAAGAIDRVGRRTIRVLLVHRHFDEVLGALGPGDVA